MCFVFPSDHGDKPVGHGLKFSLPRHLYFQLLDGDDCELVYDLHLWLDEQRISVRLHKKSLIDINRRATGRPSFFKTCTCEIEFLNPKDAMAFKLRWC